MVIFPFLRQSDWDLERLHDLPKAMWQSEFSSQDEVCGPKSLITRRDKEYREEGGQGHLTPTENQLWTNGDIFFLKREILASVVVCTCSTCTRSAFGTKTPTPSTPGGRASMLFVWMEASPQGGSFPSTSRMIFCLLLRQIQPAFPTLPSGFTGFACLLSSEIFETRETTRRLVQRQTLHSA